MSEVELFIGEDGEINFLHDDDVQEALGEVGTAQQTRRASHVEPMHNNLWSVRIDFLHEGRLVYYTMVGFKTRKRALEIEKQWLHHYFSTGLCSRYIPHEDKLVHP